MKIILASITFFIGIFVGMYISLEEGKNASYWKDEYGLLKIDCEGPKITPIPELSVDEKVDKCIEEAKREKIYQWNFKCEQLDKEESCSLPNAVADRVDSQFDEDKYFCVSRYK